MEAAGASRTSVHLMWGTGPPGSLLASLLPWTNLRWGPRGGGLPCPPGGTPWAAFLRALAQGPAQETLNCREQGCQSLHWCGFPSTFWEHISGSAYARAGTGQGQRKLVLAPWSQGAAVKTCPACRKGPDLASGGASPLNYPHCVQSQRPTGSEDRTPHLNTWPTPATCSAVHDEFMVFASLAIILGTAQ